MSLSGPEGVVKHLHISSQKAHGTQISETIHKVGIQTQHSEYFVFQGTCWDSSEHEREGILTD